jgi:hypothetical protein
MKFNQPVKLKFLENLCKYRQLRCHLPYERHICLGDFHYTKCKVYQEKEKQAKDDFDLNFGYTGNDRTISPEEQTKRLKKGLEEL